MLFGGRGVGQSLGFVAQAGLMYRASSGAE